MKLVGVAAVHNRRSTKRVRRAVRAQSEDRESPFEALRDRSPGRDVGFGA